MTMKYWINEAPGDDKFVIWDGSTIYKSNPKENDISDFKPVSAAGGQA